MKMKAVVLVFILAATVAAAQTTNLTSLLQQGLLEEQANRNLDAAIANYQTLAAQFDKDRQLAATAVFRIGECYRMQGRTNEAAAQYQRVLHDFADQTTLATLSRQNLTGMGFGQANTSQDSGSDLTNLERLHTAAQSSEMRSLAAQLFGIEKLKSDPTEYASAVQAIFPDDRLNKMLENLPKLQVQEVEVRAKSKVPGEPVTFDLFAIPTERFPINSAKQPTNALDAATAEVQKQIALINQRVDFILGIQKARLKVLQSAAGSSVAEANHSDNASVTTDEEDQEIRRIQQMIQNSPDLIDRTVGDDGTPLFQAASKDQLRVASYLLEHGANVNAIAGSSGKIWYGWTPLIGAANYGHKAVVELLLRHGADVNLNDNGKTALSFAAQKGFPSVVEVLLTNKASVNIRDNNGNTSLSFAVRSGQEKIVQMILDQKADTDALDGTGNTPLITAVSKGNTNITALLLTHGAAVNAQGYIKSTPLIIAAGNNQLGQIKILLAAGANPNVVNDYGVTPLSAAAEQGSPEIIAMLLAAGANPNVNDSHNRTPLSYAAIRNSPEMVKMLLAAKAGPNVGKYCAPLLLAIFQKDTNSVELLLRAGANPNVAGGMERFGNDEITFVNHHDNLTPLWLATYLKQLPLVQLLLKYKADPNDKQTDGQSLLFSALGDTNILTALLDAGAKVDPVYPASNPFDQQTPLDRAAYANNAAAVEILLKHGANPNVRNPQDVTSLHYAAFSLAGSNVFQMLLDYKANPNVRATDGKTPLDYLKQVAEGTILPGVPRPSLQSISLAGSLADFLRQRGALDKLPDWDHITISRPSANLSKTVFYKGSNDWNQVSLYDLIGVQYDLLTPEPAGKTRRAASPYSNYAHNDNMPFPDFTSVVIHHPSADGLKWETRKMDLASALNSGNCDGNVLLQFGDVVEIPEANHVLYQQWRGLTTNELFTLKSCLTRHLQITVNKQTTNFVVSPQISIQRYMNVNDSELPPNVSPFQPDTYFDAKLLIGEPFTLWPILNETKMLLSSSDLTQVKVKRTEAATGKVQEWIVDCSNPKSPPNFWLRDGDVIEVPEKQ